jgi:hypothetical protein
MSDAGSPDPLISVVMPCLDEEEAIGACIEKIQRTFDDAGLSGEVVVCDNGSTDLRRRDRQCDAGGARRDDRTE